MASTSTESTASDGSPRRVFIALPAAPTTSPRRDVRELDAASLAEELDAARAVDEIEEGQLAVLAPRHDATRETPLGLALLARLETLRLGADESDLVPVGEAFCSHGWILSSVPLLPL